MSYLPLPKERLAFLPTPLIELRRLSEHLGGPRILMKRDDLTGLALGGNKTRKLEYFLADALAQGANLLVTAGAEQSNHCRQTTAAAAACGLGCHLVLGGHAPTSSQGNYLLDRLLGATVHWAGEDRKGETIPGIVEALREKGDRPYVIPYGGSNAIGAVGFVEAMAEAVEQLDAQNLDISHILFASSSGGTHAGLTLGKYLHDKDFELIGIEIDKDESGVPFAERIADLANDTADLLGVGTRFTGADITLHSGYLGEGYGVVGELERRAISLLARTEGILLDPVYTGRAMGGLIDMIERGELTSDETVLFWHTGGAPSLFAYGEELTAE